MRRKLLYLMLILLVGCSNRNDRVVEVKFWHAMGGPLGKALNELVEEFNEENPGIHIMSVSMGNYQALTQKIMASILAGNPPTIAQVYESWTSSLTQADAIQPIEDFIYGEDGLSDEDVSDIFPIFIKDNTWNGRFITIPFNKSVTTYFYNTDMFEEEGIERFPGTWGEFLEAAKRLTKDTNDDGEPDIWGTAFPVNAGMFAQILHAKGGRLLSPNEKQPMFQNDEGVEAIKFIYDLIYTYRVAYLTTGYEHQDDFIAGNVAIISGSSVSYSFIKEAKPRFRIGLAPPPGDKKKAVFIAGTNVAIFRNSGEKEKEAAWKFIKWFISKEIQARWAIRTGYLPVRKSTLELPEVKQHLRSVPGLRDVWASLDYALIEPRTPGWLVGRRLLSDVGIEPVLRGGMAIEESLTRCAGEVERALALK
jgi:multiple sugar transport system substrate-binding protein